MKGALHNEDFDTFLACVDDPKAVMEKLEGAVKDF